MDKTMVFSDEVKTEETMSLDELANDGKKVYKNDFVEDNEVEDVEVEEDIHEDVDEVEESPIMEEKVEIPSVDIDPNKIVSMENTPKKEQYIIPKDLDSIEFP